MKRLAAWWETAPLWKKILAFVPLAVIFIAAAVLSIRPKSGSVKTESAVDAVDSVANTAEGAIKEIEEANEEIKGRADSRSDAVIDAASEPCGQFDSAANLYRS